MITVTIKHGLQSLDKQFNDGATVSDILGNSGILSVLEASEASAALVGGRSVGGSTSLRDGDQVVLEQQVASKA